MTGRFKLGDLIRVGYPGDWHGYGRVVGLDLDWHDERVAYECYVEVCEVTGIINLPVEPSRYIDIAYCSQIDIDEEDLALLILSAEAL